MWNRMRWYLHRLWPNPRAPKCSYCQAVLRTPSEIVNSACDDEDACSENYVTARMF